MISPRGGSPIDSSKPRDAGKPAPALILASESPRRKALLAQVGITPEAIRPAALDETPRRQELPRAYALRIATAKAEAVASAFAESDALVLAADTVVACGRRILPKAGDDDTVRRCLALLSGRNHVVMTAVALMRDGSLRIRLVETRVAFRRLGTDEIDAYVRSGEGLGKAGGYAIQGLAEIFVRRINGSWSNVVGLPLCETVGLLRACGLRIP